jgi:pyridoxamine 5'-phosphate oxidase
MVDFLRFFRKISCPNILESTAIKMEELRKQYSLAGLDESAVNPDPFTQFTHWFEEAQREITDSWFEVNAMALATADKHGTVSNRIVLLKGVDEIGFRFFTNYESEKAQQIEANPNASLLFFWPQMERQIRISGTVHKTSFELSKKYFESRPVKSRISAVASPQSKPVANRGELEDAVAQVEESIGGLQLDESKLHCPDYWGGYHVAPKEFEFWQGRENRLHDRLQYYLNDPSVDENGWAIRRLGP